MDLKLLRTLAATASQAIDESSLLEALHSLTDDLSSSLGTDCAVIFSAENEPPALVLTVQRALGPAFVDNTAERVLEAYRQASEQDLSRKTAVIAHGKPASLDGADEPSQFLGLPLTVQKQPLGYLAVISTEGGALPQPEKIEGAAIMAGLVLQAFRRIRETSSLDELTGLFNRRRIQEELEHAAVTTSRFGQCVSIAVIDIDNLKAVNEAHGHLAGDQILREFANLLREVGRASDVIGRIGGDDFVVIMPQTKAEEGSKLCARLLSEVRAHAFCDGLLKTALHVSIGVADTGGEALAAHELIGRADKALYEAKKSGGNRIITG